MSWACATVAPWALGIGLLVSFTATAGQEPDAGVSAVAVALSPVRALIDPVSLIPPAQGLAVTTLRLPGLDLDAAVTLARLPTGFPASLDPETAGFPPRDDLKISARDYPAVERARKGDPLVVMRPTLSRRGLDAGLGRDRPIGELGRMVFSTDERALPPTILMRGSLELPPPETMTTFEPWAGDTTTATGPASAPASPQAGSSGGSSRGARPEMVYDAGRPPGALDGGTPSVPRAQALGSTTPAPLDATPVAIAAAPVSIPAGLAPNTSVATKSEGPARPRYADLIDPERMSKEQRCLAEAIYFEARSESEDGQAAVAQVVLNRVRSGLYPGSVCGVVYQNRHRYNGCQFSFACEGKSLRVTEPEPWQQAVRIAREVVDGRTYLADVGGATHYHANYVRPFWARRLKKMDVIGRHIFYKLRPGQT